MKKYNGMNTIFSPIFSMETRLTSSGFYSLDFIEEIIDTAFRNINLIRTNKDIEYYNISCAFDIETSSFFRTTGNNENEKCAIMYEWTLGINGYVIIGRTWNEFIYCLDCLIKRLNLSLNHRLIIYDHNLSYEFQFIRKIFKWEKVFSMETRKPIYALTDNGIEFRCSYILSGYSLAKLSEHLTKYKCNKMVGDLDYSLVRHSQTELTNKELKYCENDVRVVMCYIQDQIDEKNISKIPLTKTGYVRNYCRNYCLYENKSHKSASDKYRKYRRLMNELTLEPKEYLQLKRAFQGGFTHANSFYSGELLCNVESQDFTSSYPYILVSEKMPMSKGEKITINSKEELKENLMNYCCLFDVEITGVKAKILYENPISYSRCIKATNCVINNGRIVSADKIYCSVTEQDYFTYIQFYEWENITISNFIRYKKGYLPTDLIKSILNLYENKTKLKGIEDKQVEYLRSKEMINAVYGMMVTDICRDDIIYDDDWNKERGDINKLISNYNKQKRRFLFYPWGVWVTAYARRNLFSGIYECGNDYIYSDTDSIKFINADNHREYFKKYNEIVIKKLNNAMVHHGIDKSLYKPKTIKGIEKPLGVWDFDGRYKKFKTLGAKRYMIEDENGINLTVSGINKKFAVPFLKNKYKDAIFDAFKDGLYIPPEYSGKNTHTYIDEEKKGIVKDYQGAYAEYHELSSVHLMNAEYTLTQSKEYIDYLLNIREKEN